MSTMFSRALMVMRSLSFKTHTFTLCVLAGTLLLCMGFFNEPNIDVSHSTTSVYKELDTASASNLTISIEVGSICMDSLNSESEEEVVEISTLSVEDKQEDDFDTKISFSEYLEFAKLVEAEAASEDLMGRSYVASVVMNRVASDIFPNTITDVINDPGQFDPVTNKSILSAVPTHDSKQAVINALDGKVDSLGALYFQKSKGTEWGDKEYLFRYDSHSFYK